MMGDPFDVVARLEERELRRLSRMTHDESIQIEELLDIWYDYERSYMPALGLPRVSVSCRNHEPEKGDTHATGADRDDLLERMKAEGVEACVDELHYLQRAAINVHMRNKRGRAAVHKNPRIEDQHRAYQTAKADLLPKLRRKGLLTERAESSRMQLSGQVAP